MTEILVAFAVLMFVGGFFSLFSLCCAAASVLRKWSPVVLVAIGVSMLNGCRVEDWYVCYTIPRIDETHCMLKSYSTREAALDAAAVDQAWYRILPHHVRCGWPSQTLARRKPPASTETPRPTPPPEDVEAAKPIVDARSEKLCHNPGWWQWFWSWFESEAGAQTTATTRTATLSRTQSTTRTPSRTRTVTLTRTSTRTRTATATRAATRTRTTTPTKRPTSVPSATSARRNTSAPTLTRTPRPTSRPTTISAKPTAVPDIAPSIMGTQAFGGAGHNSFRADIDLSQPTKLQLLAKWDADDTDALGRFQVLWHPAGLRIFAHYGDAGFYDSPWRNPGQDHKCPYTSALFNLDLKLIAAASCPATWTATYEGHLLACWPHPRLKNYTLCREHDGGPIGLAVSGAAGDRLALSLIGGKYREEVGDVALSLTLGIVATKQDRAWHGGSHPFVLVEALDGSWRAFKWNGEAWTEGTVDEDALLNGGIAIAESTRYVVATLNRRRVQDQDENGLYAWPISSGVSYEITEGLWGAPAVDPTGRYAYAVNNSHRLVELDTLTGVARQVDTVTEADLGRWSMPPIVTNDFVITYESSLTWDDRRLADLQAYRRSDLSPVWRYTARILSHEDGLSGWSRSNDSWVQADATYLIVAGDDMLYAIRHADGSFAGIIFVDPDAPEGFYSPQLYDDGAGNKGIIMSETTRFCRFPKCQEQFCPGGKPVGSINKVRCCRGTSKRCPNSTTPEQCAIEAGFGANDADRYRVLCPSSHLYVLAMPRPR